MATSDEIKIIVSAEVDKALANFKKVQKETENTSKASETMGKRIEGSFGKIAASAVAFYTAAKTSLDITQQAARFNQSAKAMEKQFGVSADSIITKLSEVSGGTIDKLKLVESANKAFALGVGKNADDLSKILEIARVRGQALGLETAQAFDDLVTGIGRGSPLILDNLGIVTKGWEDQAKAAGVAYDKNFILNQVLKDGASLLEKTGPLVKTDAESIQELGAQVTNAGIEIGQSLLPAMRTLLEYVAPLVRWFAGLPGGVKATAAAIAILTPAVIGLSLAFGPVGVVIAAVGAGLVAIAGAAAKSAEELKKQREELYKIENLNPFAKKVEAQAYADTIKDASRSFEQLAKDVKRASEYVKLQEAEQTRLQKSLVDGKATSEELAKTEEKLRIASDRLAEARGILRARTEQLTSAEQKANKAKEDEKKLLETTKKLIEESASFGKNEHEKKLNQIKETIEGLKAIGVARAELNALELYYSKIEEEINTEALKKRQEIEETEKDNRIARIEEQKKRVLDMYEIILDTAKTTTDIIYYYEVNKANERYDEELAKLQDARDKGRITEEEYNKQVGDIEKKREKDIAEARRKQAKQQKAWAIISIQINALVAMMKAWADVGFPAAIPLTIAIGAQSTAATIAAAAQPLPEVPAFADGGIVSRTGMSLVGEQGPELVSLPSGARVINNNETSSIMNESKDMRNINITVQGINDPIEFANKLRRQYGVNII